MAADKVLSATVGRLEALSFPVMLEAFFRHCAVERKACLDLKRWLTSRLD
jgi:hypothetical protein